MTFSIAGRCPDTGMVGTAVCAVSIAAWAEDGCVTVG